MNTQVKHFKKMMALMTKHKLQGHRHRWCWEFSKGRTESSKDLHDAEVLAIIASIEAHFKGQDKADVMRKKILAFAHQMRWELPNGAVDMDKVNAFCLNHGYLHKPLNDYSEKELPILINQVEKARDHFISKI
ncbi:MAG: hypothetical protein IE931_05660 [Sphingobacteriales bacterium]|nr:hypothetical protein [Sphingobacteriales bacterium]